MTEAELYKELGLLTKDKDRWKEAIPYVSSLLSHDSVKIQAKALWLLGDSFLSRQPGAAFTGAGDKRSRQDRTGQLFGDRTVLDGPVPLCFRRGAESPTGVYLGVGKHCDEHTGHLWRAYAGI